MEIKTHRSCSQNGKKSRSTFKILTGKISLLRPRLRWENNIRIVLKEIGVNMRNWVDLAQDRDHLRVLVNAELNLWVP